jgi:hypothetical protein
MQTNINTNKQKSLDYYNPNNPILWMNKDIIEESEELKEQLKLILQRLKGDHNINPNIQNVRINNPNVFKNKKNLTSILNVNKLENEIFLNSFINKYYKLNKNAKNEQKEIGTVSNYAKFCENLKEESRIVSQFRFNEKEMKLIRAQKINLVQIIDELDRLRIGNANASLRKFKDLITRQEEIAGNRTINMNINRITPGDEQLKPLSSFLYKSFLKMVYWDNVDLKLNAIGRPTEIAKFMLSCLGLLTIVTRRVDNVNVNIYEMIESRKRVGTSIGKEKEVKMPEEAVNHFNFFLKDILMNSLRRSFINKSNGSTKAEYYANFESLYQNFKKIYIGPNFYLTTEQFWFPFSSPKPLAGFDDFVAKKKITIPSISATQSNYNISNFLEGMVEFRREYDQKMASGGANVNKMNQVKYLYNECLVIFVYHWIEYCCKLMRDMTDKFHNFLLRQKYELTARENIKKSISNLEKIMKSNLYYYYDLTPTESADGIRKDGDDSLEARLRLEDGAQFVRIIGGGKNIQNADLLVRNEYFLYMSPIEAVAGESNTKSKYNMKTFYEQLRKMDNSSRRESLSIVGTDDVPRNFTKFIKGDFKFVNEDDKYRDLYTKEKLYMGGFYLVGDMPVFLYKMIYDKLVGYKTKEAAYYEFMKKIFEKVRSKFHYVTFYHMVKNIYNEYRKLDKFRDDKETFYNTMRIIASKLSIKYRQFMNEQVEISKSLKEIKTAIPSNENKIEEYYQKKRKIMILLLHSQIRAIVYRYCIIKILKYFINGGVELQDETLVNPVRELYPEIFLEMMQKELNQVDKSYEKMGNNSNGILNIRNNANSRGPNSQKPRISGMGFGNGNKSFIKKITNKIMW